MIYDFNFSLSIPYINFFFMYLESKISGNLKIPYGIYFKFDDVGVRMKIMFFELILSKFLVLFVNASFSF